MRSQYLGDEGFGFNSRIDLTGDKNDQRETQQPRLNYPMKVASS